jgi:pimeloyl-ACP methyl ester carboxylesterase
MTSSTPLYRSVMVDGMRVEYATAGRGDPVVLVHGWPVSSALWRNQIPRLAGRMCVYAPDLPGFGRSDLPQPALPLESLADALLGFLDEVGLRQASLVAHDLGAPATLLAALREPHRFQRLIVLNTTPYPRPPWLIRALLWAIRVPLLRDALTSRLGFRGLFRIGIAARKRDRSALADEQWANVRGRDGRRSLQRALAAVRVESLTRLEAGLDSIDLPVLVLWAEHDPTAPIAVARRLVDDMPNAVLETVPDAGHFLPLDAPEITAERVMAFLSRAGGQ